MTYTTDRIKIAATTSGMIATALELQLPPHKSQLPEKNDSYRIMSRRYHQKARATAPGTTATTK